MLDDQRIIAIAVSVVVGCVGAGQRSAPGNPASRKPDEGLSARAADRSWHRCDASSRPAPAKAAGWTVPVFDKWAEFAWVYSADAPTSPGTMRDLCDECGPGKWNAQVQAKGTYQATEGTAYFETMQARSIIQKTKVHVTMLPGQHGGIGQIEETKVPSPGATAVHVADEVVVFVDESGEFWSRLDRLRRCTDEALGKTK